ncbi:hypothetical protein CASFOL_006674 [Castilleja foliolosa]|uniref:Protein kinase domain-containing protein n=1 Tax=Castilleja foliolosa TaxID=1961234 RepID=A0ABD3E736_9LAMI
MTEADDELAAVLDFLRKNGLSECESALMEDIMEKSQLGSSEFEKFFFPLAPPPPLLRIPAGSKLPEVSDGGGESSKSSSDDEFVSLGSSTTELCSSEFTNPYGIRTTRPSSQSSSDRLSQFGTARDYPDFDIQNNLFWYKEKDEDFTMPHHFDGHDFYGDSTEDKFVTTVGSIKYVQNPKNEAYQDYYELGELLKLEQNDEKCGDYSCSDSRCACCNNNNNNGESVYSDPVVNEHHVKTLGEIFTESEKMDFDEVKKDEGQNGKEKYEFMYDEVVAGESDRLNEEDGAMFDDELAIYESREDDFEIFNLRIIHRKNRTGFEENKDFPIVINSIIAGRYYVTEYLGSAAFSKVVQAHDLHSGMDVCLKIIKNDKDFFDQSLDEIKLLKFVNKYDPADERHILRLYDYFYFQEHLFIVTELLRANLYEFQNYNQESDGEPYFTMPRLQVITRQCLEALTYLHDLGIIHCDLKPENILIKSYRKCEIKVIDLGSSCFQTDNVSLYVQSRSYRAPEVMLGLSYDQKIDMWSLGCILAELCSGEVLFPNEGIVMLLARMIGVIGPIDMEMLRKGEETHKYFTKEYDLYYINEDTNKVEYVVPEETTLEHQLQISDSHFLDFLRYLLEINPKKRPTSREALQHPWLSCSYEVNSC